MSVNPYDPPLIDESMLNPYEAPKAEIGTYGRLIRHELEGLASGQRIIIYAILIHFLCFVAYMVCIGVASVTMEPGDDMPNVAVLAVGLFSLVGMLAAFVVGLVGFFKMAAGLDIHVIIRVLLVFLMIVPLLGLIILLVMNSMATRQLREAGYHVGLMGAKKMPGTT